MTKPLSELITEILELEAKAIGPGGNLAGYIKNDEPMFADGTVEANNKLIALSRNHIKLLCEALREAQEVIDSHSSCSIGGLDQIDVGIDARVWLRKYSGEK